ncbi:MULTISPECIES: hypothetical protein [unclassified Chelatococcus]|uniref:DUF7940 domain-containing protein n=1 Tax=unclassified Chelatococcus TaxID=2638111 RepID=UPI001BCDEB34|nr:hypothetical protein [Chelatococcus sp.]MBS7741428.1 hypothetical protein [Chelatococcus sp. HY11]MCO5077263.1 hypothetical protein [Chelatococcus sp.]
MRLVPNWREVLRYAWSIRLLILAGALSGAEVALPLLQEILPIHRGVFASLCALTVCGAFVARIVAQNSVSGEKQ